MTEITDVLKKSIYFLNNKKKTTFFIPSSP